ncbi:M56 family metallopeptidase [Winogradskyella sp.]|uniref:M56 family metallopeptidase n=1 Tax=Winogradskyella sp. TaxID=1883156 RepID=UPI00261B2FC0|nr:M56 family metallopeptidase [Winogradskyella sp.]
MEIIAGDFCLLILTYLVHSTIIYFVIVQTVIKYSKNKSRNEIFLLLALFLPILTTAFQYFFQHELINVNNFVYERFPNHITESNLQSHTAQKVNTINLSYIIAPIWLLISLFWFSRLYVKRRTFFLKIKNFNCKNDEGLVSILLEVKSKLKIRRSIKIVRNKYISNPFATGLNKIFIPENLNELLDKKQLKNVISHELAHLKRFDPQKAMVYNLLKCCLFFQPLVFIITKKLHHLSENLCDEYAVKVTQSKSSLIESFLIIASQINEKRVSELVLNIDNSDLGNRINHILGITNIKPNKNRRRDIVISILAIPLFSFLLPSMQHPNGLATDDLTGNLSQSEAATEAVTVINTKNKTSNPVPSQDSISSVKKSSKPKNSNTDKKRFLPSLKTSSNDKPKVKVIIINNERYYYLEKNGKRTYYNSNGDLVDKNGKPLKK